MNLEQGALDPAADEPAANAEAGDLEIARGIIDDFLAHNDGGQERLIPLLHTVQSRIGYLPFSVQEVVADGIGLSPAQVYEVISFYHFFTTTPRGKFQMKVCMGTACFVRSSARLLDTLQDQLGIAPGGVTPDGVFSLEQVRCIGACGLAPAIMVNDQVHGNLTPGKLRKLVRQLRQQAKSAAAAAAAPEASGSGHAEEEA